MSREEQFRQILKKYGVTKCHLSDDVDLDDEFPEGDITVDIKDDDLVKELFKMFTSDGKHLEDDQVLGIWFSKFDGTKPVCQNPDEWIFDESISGVWYDGYYDELVPNFKV